MNRVVVAALALLAAGTARGEDVAGFVHGGVGIAFREPSDDPPFDQLQLEYDTGTVVHLEVASRYDYGLLLRVGYAYTFYDALTAGGLSIAKDIGQQEVRAGAFFAPRQRGPFGYRVGGGYVYNHEDTDEPSGSQQQAGGFVEAGVVLDAGRRATFDLAAAALKMEGHGDYDAEGAELRVGVALHTGVLDVTLGARYLALQRESPVDEDLLEFRVGLAGAWGYPEL